MVSIYEVLDAVKFQLSQKQGYQINSVQDAGRNIMINCPYHGGGIERSPSFGLIKEDKRTSKGTISMGHGNCFACGVSKPFHQIINDVLFEGEEKGQEWLLDNFGVESIRQVRFELNLEVTTTLEPIPYEEFKGYHPYWSLRGIEPSTAEEFELGYDPDRKAVVIPVKDKFGDCRMLIRRGVETKFFSNTKGTLKAELLFGLSNIYKNLHLMRNVDTVWVVESAIDAMLLWQSGRVAVALAQAIPTDEQLEMVEALPFPKVVVATDNDPAGQKGYAAFLEALKYKKQVARVIFPPDTKDIGDMSPLQIERIRISAYTKGKTTGTYENEGIPQISWD